MLSLLHHYGFAPHSCVWELTLACNLQCLHCGSFAGSPRKDELTLDESLQLADELAQLGCRRLTLAGGEPTLHPHWDTIGRRLSELGISVNLISNGWHWTDEHVQKAKAAGLTNVAFSIDGFESSHDFFRRKGSFQRILSALARCKEAQLPVSVNTTLYAGNLSELEALRPFLAEHGVLAWQIQIATPTGNMAAHADLVIKPEDMLTLIPRIAHMREEVGGVPTIEASDDIGYYGIFEASLRHKQSEIPFWIGCRAGCQVIGIESNGNIKGCLSLPSSKHGETNFVEGNIRQDALNTIWNRKGAFAYNREFKETQLGGFCAHCRFRDFCRGGCSWTSYSQAHQGDRHLRDNAYCFYHQAVKHKRYDLLFEEPLPEEVAAVT